MQYPQQPVPYQYWEEAQPAFISVCNVLKPDLVLCMGKETFYNLPNYGERKRPIKIEDEDAVMNIWVYEKNNITSDYIETPMYVCSINHPSSFGFSTEVWFNLFNKFLNRNYFG